jgi:hypothetical protein
LAEIVTFDGMGAPVITDGPFPEMKELLGAGHYRLDVVRAHLFEMPGDTEAALRHYRAAVGHSTNTPEREYLTRQAARRRAAAVDSQR